MLYIFDVKIFCDFCDFFIDIVIIVNIFLVILFEVVVKLFFIEWNFVFVVFVGFKEILFILRWVYDLFWGYFDLIFEEYNKLRKDFFLFF